MTTMIRLLGVLSVLAMAMPATAQERVGVATTVMGPVTVTRVALAPAPLKFKDDVFMNDRVVTGENAFARMLLGGKAMVTVRERSVITINEVPGVSTIDVISGRIAVAVDKARMRPGEVIEIKTPNAVAGIRGTVVVAEVAGRVSSITVLRGLVDVYRRNPAGGHAVGPPTPVGVREVVTVKAGGALPARPQSLSVDQARKLTNDFTTPTQPVPQANTVVADEVSRATTLMGALTGGAGAGGDAKATPRDAAPVTPPTTSATTSQAQNGPPQGVLMPVVSTSGTPTPTLKPPHPAGKPPR
jgi:hypothetical protein